MSADVVTAIQNGIGGKKTAIEEDLFIGGFIGHYGFVVYTRSNTPERQDSGEAAKAIYRKCIAEKTEIPAIPIRLNGYDWFAGDVNPSSLDELFEALKSDHPKYQGRWEDVPSFSQIEMLDAHGVISYDDDRAIIGTYYGDIEIIQREDME